MSGETGKGDDVSRSTDACPTLAESFPCKSEHLFRWLCDSAPVGIFVTNEQGACTYANRRLLAISGLTLAECLGDAWTQLIHPEDREDVLKALSDTVYSGREFARQFRIMTPQGEERTIAVQTTWFRSEDGELIGQVGAVEDITVRMAAEEALRESQERYRTFVENIDLGISLIDKNYSVVMSNSWQGELFHKPVGEFVGRKCFQEFEKRAEVCAHCPGAVAMRTGHPAEAETQGVRDDGSRFPVRVQAFPMKDSDGHPTGFIEVVEDISERKRTEEARRESERRFRTLFENIPIGVYRTTPDGRILESNPALVEMLGYGSFEELAGRNLEEQGYAPQYSREQFKARIEQENTVTLEDVAWRKQDGTVVFVRENARAIRDSAGRIQYYEGTVENVTARRQAAEALREREKLFRTLAETIDASITIVQDGVLRYVNPRGCRLIGRSAEEVVGKPPWEFVHPDMREDIRQRVVRRREGLPEPMQYEVKVLTREGVERWLIQSVANTEYQGRPAILAAAMDVTERKQVERALRASEFKYRTLVEQLPVIIYTAALDAASTTTYVSPQVERILGYTPEYYKANPDLWRRKIHPEDRDRVLRELIRSQDEDRPFACEYRMEASDGRVVWFCDDAAVVRDEDGQPLFLQGVMLDISERKRAEEELKKFKTVVEQSPHGAMIVDLEGKILYLNEAAARMHGYAAGELLGRHVSAFHSEDQMPNVNRLLVRLLREGQFVTEEVWHRKRDGSVFPTLMNAAIVTDDRNRPQCSFATAVDITERKRVEAEVRRQALVFENINDGIIITDREGRITDWNPGAERIFDYFKHEVIGQSPEMLNRPDEAKLLTRNIHEGIRRDGYWADDVTFVRKDGSEGACEAFLVPLRDEGGEWIGTIAVNRDITARKQAEEEKARLEAELMQAQKMEVAGTLASGIAHDFNNLLTVIFGHADLARSALPEDHPATASVQMIEQAGNHIRGVINSLLTFTLHGTTDKSPVNLVDSLTDTLKLLRRLLPSSVEIEEIMPPEKELWVNADAAQLQQIWMNLAINARDAMPQGGRLRFSLRGEVQAGEPGGLPDVTQASPSAVVVVEDTGVGMTETVKTRIFEPFFTTKARGQGCGLGMSLIHAIVADHGGQIHVESEPGSGTRATIRLPCCNRPAAGTLASGSPFRRLGRGQVVLIVEHDDHVRSILVSALRSEGYAVEAAAADAAQRLDDSQHVNLVVLDWDLLETDGLALVKRVRETLGDIPVLIITGAPDDLAIAPALDGRDRLLPKPFHLSELNRQVFEMLAGSSGEEEVNP